MEVNAYLIWNVVVTLVLAPIWFSIRRNEKLIDEAKTSMSHGQLEVAQMYVTKKDLAEDVSRILTQQTSIIDSINRLDAKVDSLLLEK